MGREAARNDHGLESGASPLVVGMRGCLPFPAQLRVTGLLGQVLGKALKMSSMGVSLEFKGYSVDRARTRFVIQGCLLIFGLVACFCVAGLAIASLSIQSGAASGPSVAGRQKS